MKDREGSVFDKEAWREVLQGSWRLFKLYPMLAFWPLTLYLRFFERERLDRMVAEANREVKQ